MSYDPCPDCQGPKDTPITATFCTRCVARRIGVTPEQAARMIAGSVIENELAPSRRASDDFEGAVE